MTDNQYQQTKDNYVMAILLHDSRMKHILMYILSTLLLTLWLTILAHQE